MKDSGTKERVIIIPETAIQKETTSDKVKTMPLPRNWPETSSSKALWAETIVTPGSSIPLCGERRELLSLESLGTHA
jgi:hypothetical protein